MMNIHIHADKQSELVTYTETIETGLEKLADCGFTSEEIVSVLWLQKWYQTGGSDRVVLWATGSFPSAPFSIASWNCKKDDVNR
jgi:hypothetical protein